MKTVAEVRFEREQLAFHVHDFLRRRGWLYTSSTPGSLWLWEKVVDGRTLLVMTETALSIEELSDPEKSDGEVDE
jgi:hypothetical protein